MFGIEKWIFQTFPKMPAPVRIVTYLVILLLFVYLILVPRFVDGQIVKKIPDAGGFIPYRGTDLQIQVDGRAYKFRTNEDGWFSIPIIGRMPESLTVQVFHADKNLWFPVTLSAASIWSPHSHEIEILDDKPYVTMSDASWSAGANRLLARAAGALLHSADAQTLVLGSTIPALPEAERTAIRSEVFALYAKVGGRPAAQVEASTSLADAANGGLTYTQRIQLVTAIEQKYRISIPDEHWQAMSNVGQLADYVAKRQQLAQATGEQKSTQARSWAQIQQSFPPSERPVYKR